MKIPEGYLPIMPYLIVNNSAKFISFMQNVFNAEARMKIARSEGVIMHGELQIEDVVIMFADATDEYQACPAGMFLYLSNVEEIYKKVIANNFKILNPLASRDYGLGFGFADDFGNTWWVNTPL